MPHVRLAARLLAIAAIISPSIVACAGDSAPPRAATGTVADSVVPNDNRVAGGKLDDGVLRLRLVARTAVWRPDIDVDSLVTVQTFAEEGGSPRIPGPLVRATEGTEVEVTLRNALDTLLVVSGLRAGAFADDTVQLPAGATRSVRFTAGAPGTYLYWGTTTGKPIEGRQLRDGQLTGAIVIDPRGAVRDSAERIFVMTVLDYFPPDTALNPKGEDIWDLAINGRSWPHTERLTYPVGESVRWRWLNGSYLPHPMHLHGFHFDVLSKANGNRDSVFTADQRRTVNTEFMSSGSTFTMSWTPTRAGQWLMHCHMIPHITPYPERPDSARAHETHDVANHPQRGMSGLVLGVTTVDRSGVRLAADPPIARRLRLLAQQSPAGSIRRHGYVLQQDEEPAADSVAVPGTTLLLTRGEHTAITVVNRMREATAVHWHGMEIESVYDGVPGWGSTPTMVAPMIAPGDSFTVTMTPPRAGTFIYHTHIDEGKQLSTGMYGPMLVLEPGARFDPATDHPFVIGTIAKRDTVVVAALNGAEKPALLELRAGVAHRLRMINIHSAAPVKVQLLSGTRSLTWQAIAKDGADLAQSQRTRGPAMRWLGTGETFDVLWTADRPMRAQLTVVIDRDTLRQEIRVR